MPTDTKSKDYLNLVELLSVYTEAQRRLDELQLQIDDAVADAVEPIRKEYATLQSKHGDAERAIVAIVETHPEWLIKPRTIKTPCGSVSAKSSTKLDVISEESSLRLIKASRRDTEFVRVAETLDLEALEKCTDEELAAFGIVRVSAETFTVKPAKLDMGKAIKSREEAATA